MTRHQQPPPPRTIVGEVLEERHEEGHHFQIELLPEPRLVGAGLRTHRLWDNGQPALGGQWHYDIESARFRADYIVLCDTSARIALLEARRGALEGRAEDAFRNGFAAAWEMAGYGDYNSNENASWEVYRDQLQPGRAEN